MGVSFDKGGFIIEPAAGEQEVRKLLKDYEPWRHKIDFTNGISTTDFKTFTPFNPAPTSKIQAVERELGPLSGYKRALDVGCNAG